MRFPLEVFRAMREAWPDDKPMSVRISATDWADGGLSAEDVDRDRAHVRGGGLRPDRRLHRPDGAGFRAGLWPHVPDAVLRPDPQRGRHRHHGVGDITTADQINTIIAAGRADLVALARPHLIDPNFTMKAAAWYGADIACPPQYLSGHDQLFRNSVREREDMTELKRKAKPKAHATTWKQAAE